MLIDKKVSEFIDEVASDSSVPGGGSVAALSGAISAALVSMVSNLTIGKKGYEDKEEHVKEILVKSEKIRHELTLLIDEDSKAFEKVMKAFKLPKETQAQKELRTSTIQQETKNASLIPLKAAKSATEIFELARYVLLNGNKNAASDAAVSVMLARTAVLSACYNVLINLSSIKDHEFVQSIRQEVEQLQKNALETEKEILSLYTF
jgi:formiminotetrahydrofolate cyclodeaminase